MDSKSPITQFCNAILTVRDPFPVDSKSSEIQDLSFDSRNDEALGNRLVSCLQEGRLPYFKDALLQLRDFISEVEDVTDDQKQLREEASEVLEDTLSLLGLVDFAVANSKSAIPVSVIKNIGRLFRRLSMNLHDLVTCWETLRKQMMLKWTEEEKRKKQNQKFWKMMKWVAVEAMIVTAGIGLIYASPGVSSRLAPLLTNVQQAIATEAAAEGIALPMAVLSSFIPR